MDISSKEFKRESKKLKKMGLSDNQIESVLRRKEIESILSENCGKASKDLHCTIKYSEDTKNVFSIYLIKDNKYYLLLVDYKLLVCEYESGLKEIKNDLTYRLHYII